jgi:type IX secretion system PorP/SprF family membrane protein
MKKLISILIGIISGATLYAQQMPLSENYFMDKYSLSPSYAGSFNNRYLFMGFRSDWTGVDGGPKTFRLSYNDSFMHNAGFGGKFIYDKAGIFKQTIFLGTYSYKVKIIEDSYLMFGLSGGFYNNTLNLSEYYNDPKYNLDPSLINANVRSNLKFMSEVSAVYTLRGLEAGFLFSNINFGDAKYANVQLHYKPLANYQVHASYQYRINEIWDVNTLLLLRGGKYIKSQFEIASQVQYMHRVWGSILYRDPNIWGVGVGAKINKLLIIGYNFNIASSVASRFYNNHEISLGINIFELTKPRTAFIPSGPPTYPIK